MNISIEEYERRCDLFDKKLDKLLSKEVDEISVPFAEIPEIFSVFEGIDMTTFFPTKEFKRSNYLQVKADLLKANGINLYCKRDPLTFEFIIRIEEVK